MPSIIEAAEGGGIAAHFQPHVEAFLHAEFFLHIGEGLARDVERDVRAHFFGQVEAVLIHIGNDDIARTGVPDDGGGHEADRTRAGDQHVFAEDVEAERGVHGVAEGIEDAGHIKVDARAVVPHVAHGQGEILREGAGAVDADADGVRAEMAPAGEAIAAAPTDDVAFAAHDFAGEKVVHIFADFDDLADELMADDHRHGDGLLRPGVPFVDVQVGAADAGAVHLDEHVVDAAFGIGHILEPEAGFGFRFDEGFHKSGKKGDGRWKMGKAWASGIVENDNYARLSRVYDAKGMKEKFELLDAGAPGTSRHGPNL